jgi:hypothetical protein
LLGATAGSAEARLMDQIFLKRGHPFIGSPLRRKTDGMQIMQNMPNNFMQRSGSYHRISMWDVNRQTSRDLSVPFVGCFAFFNAIGIGFQAFFREAALIAEDLLF